MSCYLDSSDSCFYYTTDASYEGPIFYNDFAYFTYSGEITNNGEYKYTFTAHALCQTPIIGQSYVYCAVINDIQDTLSPDYISAYSYKSGGLGTAYNYIFRTKYGDVGNLETKDFNVKLAIIAYYTPPKVPYYTYYTEKLSFNYNITEGTNYEYVGVYLFSISLPGTFVGTESAWQNLCLIAIGTFNKNSNSSADTGIASGYVSCTGTSVYTTKLTVYSEKITGKTSILSTKSMVIGESTIYVIGIRRNKDSSSGGSTTYRYTCSTIAKLTSSSWSTTKPSIA